eukprot:TRINITY_DN1908_c0_g1_i1.p1 TRINITY_DN1908_c0_g1~~TRINITY_DN1908_c0_g1_i1.p1  ORF type:complete len:1221 (+),score=332.91 TRINITY_DN1908_c0_g1_i1:61-3723(+)
MHIYIKSITFGGFRSYKEGGLLGLDRKKGEEFSPMVNMVVGKNGSGKSNFFAAIQFVLGQGKYRTIPTKDRKELIHEGAGNKVLSAYVEIQLDNSEGRFSFDTEAKTIVIRRTLGQKKDEYRVNDRSTTAAELQSMLEAAGFSPSNPYNIVEQGKVSTLATMKDTYRFNILKEVAGTHVYEDRRSQSMKLITQAETDMAAVADNISTIKSKLEELGEEREEFKVHQALHQSLKCLQYVTAKAEKDAASKALRDHDAAFSDKDKAVQETYTVLQEKMQNIKQLERSAASAGVSHQQLKRQKDIVMQERTGWLRRHARARVASSVIANDKQDAIEEKARTENALAAVSKEIAAKQAALEKQGKALHAADEKSAVSLMGLNELSSRVDQLVTKKGRHNQFGTRAERDKYLKKEIARQNKTVEGAEEDLEKLQAKLNSIPEEIEKRRAIASNKRKEIVDNKSNTESSEQLKKLTAERDNLHERRRVLFRQQGELQHQMDASSEKYQEWKQKLNKTIPRDIRQGLQSVEQVLRENQAITGVYGPVIGLFSTDKELFTACDVMAGTSLFHIVVETNEVASKILRALNEKKLPGRPSFYPLNRMNSKPKDLPTAEDCFPLFSRLKFKDMFKAVLSDLYGRVLVCTNLQAASAHSKTHGCDCVLANGDKVDARGGISGGFLDARTSRIASSMGERRVKEEIDGLNKKLEEAKQEQAAIDQKVTSTMNSLRDAQEKHSKADRSNEKEALDIRAIEKDIQQLHEAKVSLQKQILEQKSFVKDTAARAKADEEEMKTPMVDKLTSDEAKELQTKQNSLDEEKKKHGHLVASAEELRVGTTQLRQFLHENLLKREDELKEKLARIDAHTTTDPTGQENETDLVKKRIDTLEANLETIEKQIDDALQQRTSFTRKAEVERVSLQKLTQGSHKAREEQDKQKLKRMGHLSKFETAAEQIRKLGPLPSNVSKFESMDFKRIHTEMAKTKAKLGGLTKVNKKAFDQYSMLSEMLDGLSVEQKKRLNDRATLQSLVDDCDAKKDEAVLRTFKQVKLGFERNFKDLVGHERASAELILHRAPTDGDEPRQKATKVDQFDAVGVKVDFGVGGGVGAGGKSLERLSGGQKSLVALAFIFAIQQSDPAPFYIFDEIDSALDSEYRSNVARKIQELSKSAQFLIVSFKREMLDIGHKHFRISFENKVSRLARCTAEEAHRVLSNKRQRVVEDVDTEQPTQET